MARWRLATALLLGVLAACGGDEPSISSAKSAAVPLGKAATSAAEAQVAEEATVVLQGESTINRPGWLDLTASASEGVVRVALFERDRLISQDDTRDFSFQVPYTAPGHRVDRYEARGLDQAGRVVATATFDVSVNIGRVIYVAGDGNDAASGLAHTTPKRTLQAAHAITQPGDSVLVMNGTYTEPNPRANILTITRSGRADAWIAYIGFPGHQPLLKARNWNAIGVQASHIIVEGLTLEGNRADVTLDEAEAEANNLANPVTSGNGIGITPQHGNPEARPAHVIIRGNEVRDFPGGGIYASEADYLTIERNRVYRNAWYSPYANSGISIYQPWNSDNSAATKMIIRENIAYENYNYIPFYYSNPDPALRKVTDGNGIIIDDFRNTQHGSKLGIYPGRTLIENNIVFDNGGRGINIYSSNRVDVVNNTSSMNARHPQIDSEIGVTDADDVQVLNTILLARPDRLTNSIRRANRVVFSFNLIAGGYGFQSGNGRHNRKGSPQFVDPLRGDFRLLPGSRAIDAGRVLGSPPRDIAGRPRSRDLGVDIGAHESG
jgi:parallel beta-helix repeat protein